MKRPWKGHDNKTFKLRKNTGKRLKWQFEIHIFYYEFISRFLQVRHICIKFFPHPVVGGCHRYRYIWNLRSLYNVVRYKRIKEKAQLSIAMTRGSVDVEYLDMPQSGSTKRLDSGNVSGTVGRRLADDAGTSDSWLN